MKLTLNREYAQRHLFVAVLMFILAGWFGYDGFIRYPATPAAELYRSIEKSDAPEGFDLESFKNQKTKTQHGFTLLSFLASLIVSARLLKSARFKFEFDENSFTVNGKFHSLDEKIDFDWRQWGKKGIVALKPQNDDAFSLDSWHHNGVNEFVDLIKKRA